MVPIGMTRPDWTVDAHPSLSDEPTGNLDSRTGDEIMAVFSKLHAAGNTIIMVTHEPDIARQCARVVRMRDGRIEFDLPTEEAFARMASTS